jgi:tetratricopeptide (TPR) repeat protein
MNLANALIETENFEESAQCILRCFELTPSKSSLIANAKNLVPSYVQHRLFELSAKIYSCIEKYSKLTINEAFNFAMCYFTIQDYRGAIIIFKKILQQDPTDKEAEMYLSKCYSMLSDKS